MNTNECSFEIIENKKEFDYLKLEVNHLPVSIINAIRRCVLCYVENVSIDPKNIVINKNTGQLHDQFLSDRLSYIPINVSPENYDDYRIEIHDNINPDKPFKNDESYPIYIYTDNLKVYKNDKLVNEKIFVGNSQLLYLKPDQEIKFKMYLSFYGTKDGRKYYENRLGAVWNPVSQICYRYKTQSDLLGREPIIPEEQDYLGKENNEPYSYIMQVRTLGSDYITPKYVINRAFIILKEKCEKLLKEVLNDESSTIRIENIKENRIVIQIYNGEEHTLGHMIQDRIDKVQRFYGESRENLVSYKIPHQLTEELHFIIQNDPNKIKITPLEVFTEGINSLVKELEEYRQIFNKLDFNK
jgi:DNA-directed RNA polymerase subunit L